MRRFGLLVLGSAAAAGLALPRTPLRLFVIGGDDELATAAPSEAAGDAAAGDPTRAAPIDAPIDVGDGTLGGEHAPLAPSPSPSLSLGRAPEGLRRALQQNPQEGDEIKALDAAIDDMGAAMHPERLMTWRELSSDEDEEKVEPYWVAQRNE